MSKIKEILVLSRINMSEWSDVSTCGLLFRYNSIIKLAKQIGLAKVRHHHRLTNK